MSYPFKIPWYLYPAIIVLLVAFIGLMALKGVGNYGVMAISTLIFGFVILAAEQQLNIQPNSIHPFWLIHIGGIALCSGLLLSLQILNTVPGIHPYTLFLVFFIWFLSVFYRSIYRCIQPDSSRIIILVMVFLVFAQLLSGLIWTWFDHYSILLTSASVILVVAHDFFNPNQSSLKLLMAILMFALFNYLTLLKGVSGFVYGGLLMAIFFVANVLKNPKSIERIWSWLITIAIFIILHVVNLVLDYVQQFHQIRDYDTQRYSLYLIITGIAVLIMHFYPLLQKNKRAKHLLLLVQEILAGLWRTLRQSNVIISLSIALLIMSHWINKVFFNWFIVLIIVVSVSLIINKILKILKLRQDSNSLLSAQYFALYTNRPSLSSAHAITFSLASIILYGLLFYAIDNSAGRLLVYLRENTRLPVSQTLIKDVLVKDEYLWINKIPNIDSQQLFNNEPARVRYFKDRWSVAFQENKYAINAMTLSYIDLTLLGIKVAEQNDEPPRIIRIREGSWAERQNLHRGDQLLCLNTRQWDESCTHSMDNFKPIRYQHKDYKMAYLRFKSSRFIGDKEFKVYKEESSDENMAVIYNVLNQQDKTIGYFYFDSFNISDDSIFHEVFAYFKEQEVSELILDLRYNHGGFLIVSQYLASLIAGNRFNDEVFAQVKYNQRNNHKNATHILIPVDNDYVLNITRLVVLTTEQSCSASEWLINGLRPFMEITIIGTKTCGKPVGSNMVNVDQTKVSLIKFKGYNAKGIGEFFNGLEPDYIAEDDLSRDLGDPDEEMLSTALDWIETSGCK